MASANGRPRQGEALQHPLSYFFLIARMASALVTSRKGAKIMDLNNLAALAPLRGVKRLDSYMLLLVGLG